LHINNGCVCIPITLKIISKKTISGERESKYRERKRGREKERQGGRERKRDG